MQVMTTYILILGSVLKQKQEHEWHKNCIYLKLWDSSLQLYQKMQNITPELFNFFIYQIKWKKHRDWFTSVCFVPAMKL